MRDITTTLMIYDGQIEVEISGTYYREHKGRFDSGLQMEPDEPAHIEDITAKLGKETIELTESDIERAEEALMDVWGDGCDE